MRLPGHSLMCSVQRVVWRWTHGPVSLHILPSALSRAGSRHPCWSHVLWWPSWNPWCHWTRGRTLLCCSGHHSSGGPGCQNTHLWWIGQEVREFRYTTEFKDRAELSDRMALYHCSQTPADFPKRKKKRCSGRPGELFWAALGFLLRKAPWLSDPGVTRVTHVGALSSIRCL